MASLRNKLYETYNKVSFNPSDYDKTDADSSDEYAPDDVQKKIRKDQEDINAKNAAVNRLAKTEDENDENKKPVKFIQHQHQQIKEAPAPAGGKRRTRKGKKSKKRSAKKSRKNRRKSARKSRR